MPRFKCSMLSEWANRSAYDYRDRATDIDLGGSPLADYLWVGGALHQRGVTSDTTCTIGETEGKPAFKTVFSRDGIFRVTKAENLLTTAESPVCPLRLIPAFGAQLPLESQVPVSAIPPFPVLTF